MADKVNIESPVIVESDSKQRVAFELMDRIDTCGNVKPDQKDKKYWLTLYRQCYKAVSGSSLSEIIKED